MKHFIIALSIFSVFEKSMSQTTGKACMVSDDYLSAVLMTPEEKSEKDNWMKNIFSKDFPVTFMMQGKKSSDIMKSWTRKEETIESNPKFTVKRISFTDAKSGLLCYADVKEFLDYPAVEWTAYIKNTGNSETPVLENINAQTDVVCSFFNGKPQNQGLPEIYYSNGSEAKMTDFFMKKDVLEYFGTRSYACNSGSSSGSYLPFFNIKAGTEGIIAAIGWTGKWACSFTARHWRDTINIKAGLVKTHLKLLAGEEIRTPKLLIFFWKGNMEHAHNMFRRFMLNHHTPKQNGKPITMPMCCCTWGGMKEKSHLDLIKVIKDQKLDYDCYWIDAGWYGPKHETEEYQHMITNDWAKHVGNWNVNPTVVPNGFKKVSDAAHAANMQMLLWFEPERAINGTPLTIDHPEFFLKYKWEATPNANWELNLGDPDARKYITDYISNFMDKNGIDIYREDCNFDVSIYWHHNDKDDRIGMTEIKYVTGLYEFWDELRRRHPGMYIDNCSGGGRRIDIESLDRSVPMSRSDYCCLPTVNPTGGQLHNYGLMHWVPLNATINYTRPGNTYNFRSDMSAGIQFSLFDSHGTDVDGTNHVAAEYPYDWHRKMMADHKKARPYFYGDYFPLTDISESDKDWMVYQLDRSDLKEGMILFFRRQKSGYIEAQFKMKGLDENASYQLENSDNGKAVTMTGKTLMETGLLVRMENLPESQLWFYKKIK